MTVPVSPKRTALLAAARERILVLDGAMGTMIQGLEYDEAAFPRRRFADFHRDLRGNNDLLILTQPRGDRGHPRRVSARRRRHRRHQHLLLDLDRAGRLRPLGLRLRAQPRGRATGAQRRDARDRRGRQAALRRRRHRTDQPHRLDLARRLQSRLPRRHLRRSARRLWRADRAACSTAAPICCWSRPSSTRSTPRRRCMRSPRSAEAARHRRARDDLRHHHRQIRPPAVGADCPRRSGIRCATPGPSPSASTARSAPRICAPISPISAASPTRWSAPIRTPACPTNSASTTRARNTWRG